MRVKVCGMTQLLQVKKLEEMGVDFAGFIFYPKSPRYAAKSYFRRADAESKTADRQSGCICEHAL